MKSISIKEHIRHANYLYTLDSLGESTTSTTKLEYWCKYRKLHADFIHNNATSQILSEMNITGLPIKGFETNFFLFHHGFYFSIPYFLVKNYGFAGARFIMTNKSFDPTLAKRCAEAFDMDFKAIIIDERGMFVREVIKAKRDNFCIFLLTDLPFGYDQNSNENYNMPFGKVRYRSGFMKIAKVLRQSPYLITSHVDYEFKNIHHNITEINDATSLMKNLSNIYTNEYLTVERIDDLKNMCEFNNANSDFKYDFEYDNKSYSYYPAKDKLCALVERADALSI